MDDLTRGLARPKPQVREKKIAAERDANLQVYAVDPTSDTDSIVSFDVSTYRKRMKA